MSFHTPGPESSSSQSSPSSSATLDHTYSRRYGGQHEKAHSPLGSSHESDRLHRERDWDGSPNTRLSLRDVTVSQVHEQTEVQELGIKVPKTRKTGGFLLSSAFRTSPETRQRTSDLKGKRKAEARLSTPVKIATPYNARRLNGGSMRSSPLSQAAFSPGTLNSGDGASSRDSTEVDSIDTIKSHSPYGDRNGGDAVDSGENYSYRAGNAGNGIDPAQIVNMALNLSESRRRNFSAGQLLPPTGTGNRRAVSVSGSTQSPILQGSYEGYGVGGNLRHHLQQQRRISRQQSPGSGRKTSTPRHMSSSYTVPNLMDSGSFPLHASDATWARVQKFKQHMELSGEYRRLLRYLPPLQPDLNAPGNTLLSTSSVPGATSVEVTRTQTTRPSQKHTLGRQYNPLQLIRNRKLRARTRDALKPDVEHWTDSALVKEWIDVVEETARDLKYRGEDKVTLPPFPLDGSREAESEPPSDPILRRSESSSVLPKRPRTDWSISPAEHLADAYWLERGRNKSMIENRHHNRIFPGLQSTESLRPRTSFESRHSRTTSLVASIGSYENQGVDGETRQDGGHGEGYPSVGHSRDDTRRLKAVWHKARRRSRSNSSGLSSSELDGSVKGHRRKAESLPLDEINVGALELHMNSILSAEYKDSSDQNSLGTSEKWDANTPNEAMPTCTTHSETEPIEDAPQTEVTDWSEPNENISQKHSLDLHRFAGSRPSFEDEVDTTNPNSPSANSFPAGIDLKLSPPASRATSPSRNAKISILPFKRPEVQRDRGESEDGGAALHQDSSNRNSRQTSAEAALKPRSSFEAPPSPTRKKSFFSTTSNDSYNNISPRPTSRGKDVKDAKEPDSAVRRFFKGGRIGEIVRSEGAKVGSSFRKKDSHHEETFKDLSESETETLDETDTDDMETKDLKQRPHPASRECVPVIPRALRKGDKIRYHIDNLPSFKPTNVSKVTSSPSSPNGQDHITQQQRAFKFNTRSPRFDRLGPPNLDLSRVTSTVSTTSSGISRPNTFYTPETRDDRRGSYGFPPLSRHASRVTNRLAAILDRPGGASRVNDDTQTGLRVLKADAGVRRPSLLDRRHWSISDKPRPASPHPTASSSVDPKEIARVRALLLCSGIKAATIQRRAYQSRNPPPLFLREAAELSGEKLRTVPRKEEHVLAARMLTTCLEKETAQLHCDAAHFQNHTLALFHMNFQSMNDVVSSCIESAQSCGDQAVDFGAELTGQRPIEVRRVVDALEKLSRARRRRFRWVRRVGFGMVEWALVAGMWWIWLIVVVLRAIWRVFTGTGKVLKWILWI